MVSSITPSTAGASALGLDARMQRPASALQPREQAPGLGDRVELSSAALRASRESVREGLSQVHLALAIGHDAQGVLLKVQELARAGGGQEELDALLEGFTQRLEAAIAQGAKLLEGADINIDAEPGSAAVQVHGVDLRLKEEPGWSEIIAVPRDADANAPVALGRAAQKSLDALQAAMERLLGAARALEAHQGFLSAADGADLGVRGDLDADAARLMALQVRQGLEKSAGPIANAEPQAVLALFRV